MSSFTAAIPIVLNIEGGYQNISNDPGNYNSLHQNVGTSHGISAPTYESYIGRPPSIADMKAITIPIATAIYKKNYWDAHNLSLISDQFIANHIFDMFVNMGPPNASEVIQSSINQIVPNQVNVDGIFGKITLNTLNSFIKKYGANNVNQAIYQNQVKKYTSFGGQFLQSWLSRSKVFENWVSSNTSKGLGVLFVCAVLFGFYIIGNDKN
jgi:lysozyme family protein